jgi:MoaA/NifB/PqqE/SkfB family radical SAM enzyme
MTDTKFSLSPDIVRTRDERIDMVVDPDCPVENLLIVATHDTELEVVQACAYNQNATEAVMEVVMQRTNKTRQELADSSQVFWFKNDPKVRGSFCTVPWNHAGTNADGNIRMCCQMIYDDEEKLTSYGTVFKEDGSALSGKDPIEKFRNAPGWKELRKKFIAGERPNICKLCWDEEANGIGSRRQYSLNVFPEIVEKAILKTEEDGSIQHEDFPIEWWDLRFGNKCNLKCRSCGPTDSDQWYGDWFKLKGTHFPTKQGEELEIREIKPGSFTVDDRFNWYEDSALWHHIVDNLDTAKRFYFTGGEPTINFKHRELLQIMIDRDLAKDVVVEYNTNMAGVPDAIFDLWENFQQVNLGMSIDGIYEHFEYIRHPGKWRSAERNMRRVDRDPRLKNAVACVTVTLSIMNVFHILDMMWWMKEQNWQRIDSNVIVHNLYGPKFYNIQNLPEGMKEQVERYYQQFINDCNRRWPEDREWNRRTADSLNSILVHMREKPCDEAEWKLFLKTSKDLDEIRKEKWADSLPELAEAFRKYNESNQRKRKVQLATASKKQP